MLIALVLAQARDLPPLPAGVEVLCLDDVETVAARVASFEAAVILSDGISPETAPMWAAALHRFSGRCIEVRSEGWDGESPSPISAACTGVISGFGVQGVAAALSALADD